MTLLFRRGLNDGILWTRWCNSQARTHAHTHTHTHTHTHIYTQSYII